MPSAIVDHAERILMMIGVGGGVLSFLGFYSIIRRDMIPPGDKGMEMIFIGLFVMLSVAALKVWALS